MTEEQQIAARLADLAALRQWWRGSAADRALAIKWYRQPLHTFEGLIIEIDKEASDGE